MSLFDLDSSSSSSKASSVSSDEGTLPTCPPPPLRATYSTEPAFTCSDGITGSGASLSVLAQRRRMAELDVARRRNGTARWPNELPGTSASHFKSGSVPASSTTPDTGKFGSSIAAALSLRREEKERALLKRLQQQRRAEEESMGGEALARKDMEVGVFVTANYKALLKRNLHPVENNSRGSDSQSFTKADGGNDEDSGDDKDGPLAAYLRQLEATTHRTFDANELSLSASLLSTGDYYDRIMKAPLLEEKNASGADTATTTTSVGDGGEFAGVSVVAAVDVPAERSGSAPCAAPTVSELQDLIQHTAVGPSPTSGSSSASKKDTGASTGHAKSSHAAEDADDMHSAVLTHARMLFDLRQAKCRRGANHVTLVATARRCDERICASLFASV
ncbi:hypothetical protein JKF63_02090 [Porcisia hertigi]|uniref:Uncharacterized protein n=1 Tax=Porcisia hertigi TaxID=2761500 RepID=A0A836L2P9_9TRYP|nr:hypothetical protein JKF63_02090 [Porcisia hertigi]